MKPFKVVKIGPDIFTAEFKSLLMTRVGDIVSAEGPKVTFYRVCDLYEFRFKGKVKSRRKIRESIKQLAYGELNGY